ncbi:MAG: heavy metal-binding domain-containing protein, partial [Steroidobacteraceae bacterium]
MNAHPPQVRHRIQDHHSGSSTGRPGTPSPSQQVDTVCGMTVSAYSAHRIEFAGHEYVFCSNRCRERFQLDPRRYAPGAPSRGTASNTVPVAAAAAVAPGTIYTCPMHPQIRGSESGSCPICGMALEPLQPAAGSGPGPELRDMTRRFWIGAALALPLLLLEMGAHLSMASPQRLLSPLISV